MSPNFRIALRFLTAKKRAMLMSLSCIVLGVGLFVVTQATTSGFEKFFIRTILGTDGAIRIQDKIQSTMRTMAASYGSGFEVQQKEGRKYIEGIEEPKLLIEALQSFSNISGLSVVLSGPVTITSSFKTEQVRAYGIYIDEHLKVCDLKKQIVRGSLDDFRGTPSGALLGREMAERLQLEVGDSFQLQVVAGELRRYKVSAIYETGVSDIDRVRLYLDMTEARSLMKKPTGASFIQVNLFDKNRAPEDAVHMEEVLNHSAKPWQEREKEWLGVFHALGISTGITVSVFTLIAGLAMFNTLAMIVLEKTKDIAILRSMGYTRKDISQIFLWQAIVVLTIGTIIGCIVGYGLTYGISQTPLRLRTIFRTDTFLVDWNLWHYVQAVCTAVAMVMVASLIPARRAARLEPGDIIRGTAQ